MRQSNNNNNNNNNNNKSGSNDENSTWALARCAQCEQFLNMLELGKLPRDCPEVTYSDIPPLRLHGVVFWDEHPKNVSASGGQDPCPYC